MAFKRLSDDEDVDAGVPVDIDDDEELDDDGDDDEVEKDGVIGPEDPYKEEEEKTDE